MCAYFKEESGGRGQSSGFVKVSHVLVKIIEEKEEQTHRQTHTETERERERESEGKQEYSLLAQLLLWCWLM